MDAVAEDTGRSSYFRQYFDIWYQSLQIMKERKDNHESVNEGLYFIEVEEEPQEIEE